MNCVLEPLSILRLLKSLNWFEHTLFTNTGTERHNMKTTDAEIRSWIRKEQRKKQPNQIYINWLRKQIKLTVTTSNKDEIHNNTGK